ncbi:MAG: hypothetical protein LQ338_008363, partial [Usnochroma carphineum]
MVRMRAPRQDRRGEAMAADGAARVVREETRAVEPYEGEEDEVGYWDRGDALE